ncbi:flippase [Patescibacteria group bacterium]|nr:flippase [Patescibacteria group bacterium]
MTLTKKIASNTSIQFSSRLLLVVISLIIITFLTRYLGLEKYGNYTTAIAFVALFNVFADFGVNQIVVLEIARHPKDRHKIISAGLVLKIIIGIIVFALPPLIAFFLPYPKDVKIGILICSLATYPLSVASLFVTIFQINLQIYRNVIASVSARIVVLILTLLFIKTGKGLVYFFLAIMIGNIFEFTLNLILALPLEKISFIFDKKLYLKILTKSWPLAVVIGLGLVAFRVDTIILSLLKNQEAVGIYGVPYKIVDILLIIPGIFIGFVFPLLSKHFVNNRPRLLRTTQKTFDAMLVVGSYVLIVILLLAPYIINLIAGSAYTASVTPFKYLSLAVFLIFINITMPYLLIAAGKFSQLIWRNIFLLVVNIILNLILIPYLSYNGAAIATVIAEFLSVIVTFQLTWQLLKIFPSLKRLPSIAVASIFSFLIGISFLKTNVPINWNNFADFSYLNRIIYFIFIFIIVSFFYFLFLVIFRGIDRQIVAQLIPIRSMVILKRAKIKIENDLKNS